MESVLQKIRQAREYEDNQRAGANITETVVDGCKVKMRFDAVGDSNIITAIKSMLMSAYIDTIHVAPQEGEVENV